MRYENGRYLLTDHDVRDAISDWIARTASRDMREVEPGTISVGTDSSRLIYAEAWGFAGKS